MSDSEATLYLSDVMNPDALLKPKKRKRILQVITINSEDDHENTNLRRRRRRLRRTRELNNLREINNNLERQNAFILIDLTNELEELPSVNNYFNYIFNTNNNNM